MSVWALIPAKNPAQAKSRLARDLSPRSRRTFALEALRHVVDVARATQAVERCLVISESQEALDVAAAAGATPIREVPAGSWATSTHRDPELADRPEIGLNLALEQGARLAVAGGASTILVMAADLPLLDPASLTMLVNRLGDGDGVVLAPDRHGSGTNALVARPPFAIPFAFGRNSLERHRRLALERGIAAHIYGTDNLALDIDTFEDLCEFARARRERGSSPIEWFGLDDEIALLQASAGDESVGGRGQHKTAMKEQCVHVV